MSSSLFFLLFFPSPCSRRGGFTLIVIAQKCGLVIYMCMDTERYHFVCLLTAFYLFIYHLKNLVKTTNLTKRGKSLVFHLPF